ncbi:MAG: hypothetical protein HY547_05110 [Elusimicrobia bacterium]|nr:hypothetical protein [Elusimicrobiota bacterium]
MSYDIKLLDSVTRKPILFDKPHDIKGGTYAANGTNEAWLNVTYNYFHHFKSMGRKGIRSIYGKTGAESIPILKGAIDTLGDDIDKDYWKPTAGNAKRALSGLLAFAQMRPDGVWAGD